MVRLFTALRSHHAADLAAPLPWDSAPEAEDGYQHNPKRQLVAWCAEVMLVTEDVNRRLGFVGKHGMTMGALLGCYLGAQVLVGAWRQGDSLEQVFPGAATMVVTASVVGALMQRWRCAAVAADLEPHYLHMGKIRAGLPARAEARTPGEAALLQAIDAALRDMGKLGLAKSADRA